MKRIEVIVSQENDKEILNEIWQESVDYFQAVEGRKPLKPLGDIRQLIGNPPSDVNIQCQTIFYQNEIAGYVWTLEKQKDSYYILHFYIKDSLKRKGIGKEVILQLDTYFLSRGVTSSELLVSGNNYLGLKFWTSIGYDKIIYVEAPEENSPTSFVELELSRQIKL